jgi:hypothetical protein
MIRLIALFLLITAAGAQTLSFAPQVPSPAPVPDGVTTWSVSTTGPVTGAQVFAAAISHGLAPRMVELGAATLSQSTTHSWATVALKGCSYVAMGTIVGASIKTTETSLTNNPALQKVLVGSGALAIACSGFQPLLAKEQPVTPTDVQAKLLTAAGLPAGGDALFFARSQAQDAPFQVTIR